MKSENKTWLQLFKMLIGIILAGVSFPFRNMVKPTAWMKWRNFVRNFADVDNFCNKKPL